MTTVHVMTLAALVVAFAGAPVAAQTPQTRPPDATMARLTPILSRPLGQGVATGLLPTAVAEAQAAATQASLAARTRDDLGAMKRHAGHVLYAVDPTLGPGDASMGYGVKRAVTEIVAQLSVAASDAKLDARRHLPRALASARHVLERCDALVAVAQQLQASTDATQAATLATAMARLAQQLTAGRDINGDGKVTFTDEGGLYALQVSVGTLLGGREAAARAPLPVPPPARGIAASLPLVVPPATAVTR